MVARRYYTTKVYLNFRVDCYRDLLFSDPKRRGKPISKTYVSLMLLQPFTELWLYGIRFIPIKLIFCSSGLNNLLRIVPAQRQHRNSLRQGKESIHSLRFLLRQITLSTLLAVLSRDGNKPYALQLVLQQLRCPRVNACQIMVEVIPR